MDIVGGATLERPSAKLDHEIFEDGPTVKIGSLEIFQPYGIHETINSLSLPLAAQY